VTALRPARLIGGDPAAAGLLPPGRLATVPVGCLAALLAFLAVLALALMLAAGRLAATWQGELADAATLQIFAPEAQIEEQARAALDVLRTTPGVRSVRMVDLAEQERLLEPWLGPDVPVESLPLPVMVEVEADRAELDAASLALRLQAEAPGAIYDDHAAWRQPLIATAGRVRLFAAACLGLAALALGLVVGVAASGELARSGGTVGTLRLVGARDRLIRKALTRRPVLGALAGAVAGTAAGAALVATLPRGSEQGFFLAGIGLAGWQWLLPLLVPAAAGAVAWAAAALVARRGLRRWS
jgi:cell division transport system permease protein